MKYSIFILLLMASLGLQAQVTINDSTTRNEVDEVLKKAPSDNTDDCYWLTTSIEKPNPCNNADPTCPDGKSQKVILVQRQYCGEGWGEWSGEIRRVESTECCSP